MKMALCAIVGSILLLSCNVNPTDENLGNSNKLTETSIVGKWLWVESIGGFTGKTVRSPDSVEVTLEFTADGSYIKRENSLIVDSSAYSIVNEKTIFSSSNLDVVHFSTLSLSAVIGQLTTTTLKLEDNVTDGFVSTYTRVQSN